jgi:hypothetical protein
MFALTCFIVLSKGEAQYTYYEIIARSIINGLKIFIMLLPMPLLVDGMLSDDLLILGSSVPFIRNYFWVVAFATIPIFNLPRNLAEIYESHVYRGVIPSKKKDQLYMIAKKPIYAVWTLFIESLVIRSIIQIPEIYMILKIRESYSTHNRGRSVDTGSLLERITNKKDYSVVFVSHVLLGFANILSLLR